MNARTLIVVILALVCGGAAALGISRMRGDGTVQAAEAAAPETVDVLVAKNNLLLAHTVTDKDVELVAWPKGMVPEGALVRVEDAMQRVPFSLIYPGEVVLDAKLADRGAGVGLPPLIPPGMRAFTIQAETASSNVAGFVLPGYLVDVLLTVRSNNINDGTGGGSSVTLLQAVKILAVDQQLGIPKENMVDPDETQSITLLVTPEQAQYLDVGRNLGVLSLSLRNPDDLDEVETDTTLLAKLRELRSKLLPEPAAEPAPPVSPARAGDTEPVEAPAVVQQEPKEEVKEDVAVQEEEQQPEKPVVQLIRTYRGPRRGTVEVVLPKKQDKSSESILERDLAVKEGSTGSASAGP